MDDPPPEWLVTRVAEAGVQSITDWRQPGDGANAETYIVESDDRAQPVVYKGAGASVWTGDVIEPLVTDYVDERTTLPVPTVLAHGTGSPHGRWAVYEYCAGDSLRGANGSHRRQLLRAAGRLLGRLHAQLPGTQLGRLACRDGALVVTADAGVLATPLGRRLKPAADRQPVIHHGDYHPGNILVSDGQITGMLDWGNAYVTDADYAAAVGELRCVELVSTGPRKPLRQAFRRGYQEHNSLGPGYRYKAPGYKLLWVLQSGRNMLQVAKTSRGRRQLGRQINNWLRRRW